MAMNPNVWFEIYVDNMERAQAFYEKVFDIKLSDLSNPNPEADFAQGMQMLAFPSYEDAYGATGALVKMKGVTAGQNSVMVYFNCEDCLIEQGRVESAGGKVIQEKMPIGEFGFMSVIQDTEGNQIGLHSK